jgi:hypothetical protein
MPRVTPPCPQCPAAYALAGPPATGPSVLCKVAEAEVQSQDVILHGSGIEALVIEAKRDPGVYYGFCAGTGIPMIHPSGKQRGHYTGCPHWQAEKERIFEARKGPAVLPAERHNPALEVGEEPLTRAEASELVTLVDE